MLTLRAGFAYVQSQAEQGHRHRDGALPRRRPLDLRAHRLRNRCRHQQMDHQELHSESERDKRTGNPFSAFPEQRSHNKQYEPACGVTLYFLLQGPNTVRASCLRLPRPLSTCARCSHSGLLSYWSCWSSQQHHYYYHYRSVCPRGCLAASLSAVVPCRSTSQSCAC